MLQQQVIQIVTQLSDEQLQQVYDYVMVMWMSNMRPRQSGLETPGKHQKERLLQFQGLLASTFTDTSVRVDELLYGDEPSFY